MKRYETRVVATDPANPDPAAIEEAASLLKAGEAVAFPTETVYGIGAVFDERAIACLYEAKGRPEEKALVILVAEPKEIERLVEEVTLEARALIGAFWPGPLTIILKRSPAVPDVVTSGGRTVGLRCPESRVARALIRAAGGALATTSANLSGSEAPVDAPGVIEQLGGRIPLVLDGGRTPIGVASTVVDLTVRPAKILREGSLTKEELGY